MQFVLDSDKRRYIRADGDEPHTVKVIEGDTVYYGGPSVSSSSNDGTLTSGQSLDLTVSKWLLSAGSSRIADDPQDEVVADISELEAKVALEAPLNVKWEEYGAVGDDATDDTAAFDAAAAAAGNGTIFVPKGAYRLADFVPVSQSTLRGEGNGTQLKALAGADYVIDMTAKRSCAFENFRVDGNSKASSGVKMSGTGGASFGHLFKHVRVENCDVCWDLVAGAETDKNTWVVCPAYDSNIGWRSAGVNDQTQKLIGCHFSGCSTYAMHILGGAFDLEGCDFNNCLGTHAIYFDDSTNIQWFRMVRGIFENVEVGVGCASGIWPEQGAIFEQVIFDGATNCLDINAGGTTFAHHCRFNTSPVLLRGNNHVFYELFSTYGSGSSYSSTGTNNRRMQWLTDGNGFDFQSHASVIRSLVTSSNPLTLAGHASQAAALLPFKKGSTLKSEINSNGEFVSDDATKGVVLKDAQATPHYWRVTVDNSGVLTTTDVGTTRPD